MPTDTNIVGGMFVINIRDVETDTPIYKARYVMHRQKDGEKELLFHNNTTANQSSTWLLVALGTLFGTEKDFSQAYIQSASQLFREVYLKMSKEIQVPENCILRLICLLYGLADSGDHWNATLKTQLKKHLDMLPATSDI